MATIQSPPASDPPENPSNSNNSGSEMPKPASADENNMKQGSTSDSVPPPPPPFKISQPLREDQVQNAINFLLHPRVRNSPVIHRRSFLEKKGLTKEEIDEAFRRVPDPSPSTTAVETATANPASAQQKLPTTLSHVQHQQQNSQLPVASASMTPTMQQTKYKWSSILLAVGVVAASGAGSALLFKKVLIPKLKGWIRRVAAENEDTEKEVKTSSKVAEEAAEAAKAAASAAAIVAKASQDLLGSKSEEKKYFEAFMGALDVQVKEMKSMAEAIRKLESRKDDGLNEDKLKMEQFQSTVGNGYHNNGTFNNSWVNKQYKVNGTSNRDFGEVRPSSAPVSMEPTSVPSVTSYNEYMEMAQRGEKFPGMKPWEVPQQVQQNYSNSTQYQSSEGPNFATQESFSNSQTNGKAHDPAEPWWKKKSVKLTEVQSEMAEPRQFPYSTETAEKPKQRSWIPPQPPAVAMPEAAAAIRKPKTAPKQQSNDSRSVVSSDDGEEGFVTATNSVNDGGSSGSLTVDTYQSEIQEERDDSIEVN